MVARSQDEYSYIRPATGTCDESLAKQHGSSSTGHLVWIAQTTGEHFGRGQGDCMENYFCFSPRPERAAARADLSDDRSVSLISAGRNRIIMIRLADEFVAPNLSPIKGLIFLQDAAAVRTDSDLHRRFLPGPYAAQRVLRRRSFRQTARCGLHRCSMHHR